MVISSLCYPPKEEFIKKVNRSNISNEIASAGSLLNHRPISGLYFLIWYSYSPVTGHQGLVLKRWVKEEARSPDSMSVSPKGE